MEGGPRKQDLKCKRGENYKKQEIEKNFMCGEIHLFYKIRNGKLITQ
jgi:hypothetical protein